MPDFNGPAYNRSRDHKRLTGQLGRVLEAMKDGEWRTLKQISDKIYSQTGKIDPDTSISAQIRNLRKDRFGGHKTPRRHIKNGLYEFRLIVNTEIPQTLFGPVDDTPRFGMM